MTDSLIAPVPHFEPASTAVVRIPALYLSHGAPTLVDDSIWPTELAAWAENLPAAERDPVVSAHWEAAPLTIGSTATGTPLTYDFWGFPQHYYDVTYRSPGAPALAAPSRR